MGLIRAQRNKRATRELSEPVQVSTTLSPDQVYALAERLVGDYAPETGMVAWWKASGHAYALHELPEGGRKVVCFKGKPEHQRLRSTWRWDARLLAIPRDRGGSDVEFVVLRWLQRENGIVQRGALEEFRDHLLAGLKGQS